MKAGCGVTVLDSARSFLLIFFSFSFSFYLLNIPVLRVSYRDTIFLVNLLRW